MKAGRRPLRPLALPVRGGGGGFRQWQPSLFPCHFTTQTKKQCLTTTPAPAGLLISSTLAVPSPEKDNSCPGLKGLQTAPGDGHILAQNIKTKKTNKLRNKKKGLSCRTHCLGGTLVRAMCRSFASHFVSVCLIRVASFYLHAIYAFPSHEAKHRSFDWRSATIISVLWATRRRGTLLDDHG